MNRKAYQIKRIVAALLVVTLLLASAPAALAAGFSAVVTASSMQVYRDEDLSEKLGKLKQYTVVQVSGYSDGIARITFNGITGYAMSADMDRVEDFAKKALLVANSKIYASPNRKSASVLGRKGLHLYVLAVKNGWAMVEMNGNVGYVETDRLLKATDNWKVSEHTEVDQDIEYQASISSNAAAKGKGTTYTTRVKVAMYASASTSSKKVTTLKKWTKVAVMASNKTWAFVKVGKKTGYCQTKYLKKGVISQTAKSIAQVRVNKLPVFKSASIRSKKLGSLKKGTKVYMIRWNSKWAYIELKGHRGYTATAALKRVANVTPTVKPTVAPTPKPASGTAIEAVVSANSVTVYKKAGSASGKLGTLKKGTVVELLAAAGKWAYIRLGGKTGYCLMSALTKKEGNAGIPSGYAKETFNATVVAPGARAYASPNTAATSAAIGLGATVKVVAYNSEWACISRSSGYAFVPISQLSRAAYATAKEGALLQNLLKALLNRGFFDGVPSTEMSTDAEDAIKRFQAACGMEKTGVANEPLQRILYGGYAPTSSMLTSALSKGANNSRVTRLQSRLFALGYLSLTASIDGDYGAKTANAVSLFQKANNLVTTGSADIATLRAMYSTGAKSLPGGTRAADAGTSGGGTGTSTYMTYMPGNTASKVTSYSSKLSNAKKLEYAIYVASTKLTCPYVYGATGPSKFDCSGLTLFCMNKIGVSLQRTAYQQGYDNKYTKIESVYGLRRGDLVFFNTVSDSDLCDHVGIYLGSGYFIHASSGGHKVVCSQLLTGYYNRVLSWGRRILK